jgi:hypothetical protein
MLMEDQILLVKNVLSDQECQNLIDEFEKRKEEADREACLHAVTGLPTVATFKIVNLKYFTANFNVAFNKTEFMIQRWMEHLDQFKSFHIPDLKKNLNTSHQYRLMKYEEGGWIHPHIDGHPYIYGSCTFQLNDEFEGGVFQFWNGKHKVAMEKGDGLIFPASPFWVHEVTNITKGARYSVNSFILASSPSFYTKNMSSYLESIKGQKVYQK